MKKYIIAFIAIVLSVNVYSQVGINTSTPTSVLDINGDLRVRDIPASTSTEDISLVADTSGVVKKKVSEYKGIMRGYLSNDFTGGAATSTIYQITGFTEIDNPNNDFDSSTSTFTAPETGLYRIIITATFSHFATNTGSNNIVIGFVDKATGKWIMRFSVTKSEQTFTATNKSGYAHTFEGIVKLEAGKSYYYGLSNGLTLYANPTNSTGPGLGSYFEVQLIKNPY
ncbi:hypothetical protein [Chryseobacterium sp.]|uniref:hypothetical protein n=1 Tax=Chryseobacterium sp. TaxID=1871047 RepID=UPI0025C3D303|nr:hypothetical protein [Chryseobacterium sp.]